MKKKKTIDYIIELRFCSDQEKYMLGEKLFEQYQRQTQSMQSRDLPDFLKCIQDDKEKIGVAQFLGKFRA